MSLTNTPQGFGAVARALHWLTALLILTAIPLGVIANDLPWDTSDQMARKAQLFSLHKTAGIAAFAVAVLRILWALLQPRPVPVHPDRVWENRLADLVHWALYIALVAVPLTGWVHHAATEGFAPILWPLGQGLPLVPKSDAVAHLAGAMHGVFTKILIASVLLHVAGALKHAMVDRDGTLARMLRGAAAPARPGPAARGRGPALAALAIYLAGAGLAVALQQGAAAPQAAAPAAATAAAPGAWAVQDGQIAFSFRQMGATIRGSFGGWSADLRFDPATGTGTATVTMDTASLTVGSVTAQAHEADWFDVKGHPSAVFTAALRPDGDAHVADGTLTLKGVTVPVRLPFALAITDGLATVSGSVELDRRAFGIGTSQADDQTVGFAVRVEIALTARQGG
jgi:cytochrome b561/polyisoprenoid-binding protein YceI